MAGINILESRDNLLTLPPPEMATAGKAVPHKTSQGATAKNPPSLPPSNHKRTADQAFHDASSKIIADNQLHNEVVNLECQVLETNPTPLTEAAPVTTGEARTSNFGLFYEHEDEESHLVPLMRKYHLVDIQYIRNMKKNMFKPESIMKLSTSVRRTRESAKSFKIGTNSLEIEAKEKDYTMANKKGIIPLL